MAGRILETNRQPFVEVWFIIAWFRLRLSQDGARCEMLLLLLLLLVASVVCFTGRTHNVDGASPLQDRITVSVSVVWNRSPWAGKSQTLTQPYKARCILSQEAKTGFGSASAATPRALAARGPLRGRRTCSLFLTNFGAEASFWPRPFAPSPKLLQS